jgi:hypothetical protein
MMEVGKTVGAHHPDKVDTVEAGDKLANGIDGIPRAERRLDAGCVNARVVGELSRRLDSARQILRWGGWLERVFR